MLELISETNYRETMENTVEPKLASIREEPVSYTHLTLPTTQTV